MTTVAEKPVVRIPKGLQPTASATYNRPVTLEEAERIHQMRMETNADGKPKTVAEIADAVGRGKQTVARVINGTHPNFTFVHEDE